MTSSNTINTRIQLKSDTEARWNNVGSSFVPLAGELIIYTADSSHNYSRLKVGDGLTAVANLPFIDAGTLNGETLPSAETLYYADRNSFPSPGVENKLYIDLATNRIYTYTNAGGYTQLSNFEYTVEKATLSYIIQWSAGAMPYLRNNGGILAITSGILPSLLYQNEAVVKNITKEENE